MGQLLIHMSALARNVLSNILHLRGFDAFLNTLLNLFWNAASTIPRCTVTPIGLEAAMTSLQLLYIIAEASLTSSFTPIPIILRSKHLSVIPSRFI